VRTEGRAIRRDETLVYFRNSAKALKDKNSSSASLTLASLNTGILIIRPRTTPKCFHLIIYIKQNKMWPPWGLYMCDMY
jgi:hypothetical protein